LNLVWRKSSCFYPFYSSPSSSPQNLFISQVKVNWDELIKCSTELLSAFLVRLRTSGEVVRSIGDVLVSQIPHLTPHIRWCSCQLMACTILQQKASDPHFKEFEQSCSTDPRTGGLPLSSFLLKPMQRVTKYPLLVKRVRRTMGGQGGWGGSCIANTWVGSGSDEVFVIAKPS